MSRNRSDDGNGRRRRLPSILPFPPQGCDDLVSDLRIISTINDRWKPDVFLALGLTSDSNAPVLNAILALAQEKLGAKTVVAEPYISTDWSDEYAARFARVFQDIPRLATRLHFFADFDSPSRALGPPDLFDLPAECLGSANSAYLGYCVVRPFRPVTVGDTVLASPYRDRKTGIDLVHCATTFTVHLLGSQMTVRGMPFIQQDEAVSVCAEANLWMLARYMHAKGDARRYRPSEMYEIATRALSVGPPREGLNPPQMCTALRDMDFSPDLIYPKDAADAVRLLAACVESEIPVIVSISGHVFTVIGHSFGKSLNALKLKDSASGYIDAFVVHDDQLGPYLNLEVGVSRKSKERLTLGGDPVEWCLMAMPHRVHLREEDARLITQNLLKKLPEYEIMRGLYPSSELHRLVTRTYLRRGDQFKMDLRPRTPDEHRAVLQPRSPVIVACYWALRLPRYVWVVEFAEPNSTWSNPLNQRIVGEMLLDATSHRGEDPLRSLIAIQINGQMRYHAYLGFATPDPMPTANGPANTAGAALPMRHLRNDDLFISVHDPAWRQCSPLIRFYS
jgi:hypothetical protein